MGKNETDTNRHHKKGAFLAAVSTCGNISAAARLSDCHRDSHYSWMNDDPDYPDLFEAAMEEAGDYLEAEARRRGFAGVTEPVFYQGVVCGEVRKYSDTLLIFLLKGAKPEKYRERFETVTTGKVEVTVKHDINFYGNAHRLAALGNGSSVVDLTESGQAQTGGVRPTGGKDSHGANGNGSGPRPKSG